MGAERRALGHTIDDSAAAAAPEDHRIGAFYDLDPADVVEVAEILDVVADTIAEQVGGGVVAAQCELVAVSLASAGHRSRNKGQNIGDRPQLLVLDLVLGDDRQRLRYVLDL